MRHRARGRCIQGWAFALMGVRYWFGVFPSTRRELVGWRRRALAIPDPQLRRDAVASLDEKRRNVEGATAFAAMAPRGRRRGLVRLLAAFQAMHDYLDTISEGEADDPLANGRQLHAALNAALALDAQDPDFYAYHRHQEDGGYLRAYVQTCREELGSLPGLSNVHDALRRAAALSGEAQTRFHAEGHGHFTERAAWAASQVSEPTWLDGWELAAAACSTLTIYALLTAATRPMAAKESQVIERAYFPWITGLSALLDSLADVEADLRDGVQSHMLRYPSSADAQRRLSAILDEAAHRAGGLRQGEQHVVVLMAIVGYYVFQPRRQGAPMDTVARELAGALPNLRLATMLVFKTRHVLSRIGS